MHQIIKTDVKSALCFSSVSVIGLGYVGLPTAALLADSGLKVVGVDINEDIVRRVNAGEALLQEEDVCATLKSVVAQGRLVARSRPEACDVYVIATPTPLKEDKSADLRAVEAAFHSIAPVLKKGDLVILESTSPVGATRKMQGLLKELRGDLKFDDEDGDVALAYCPERILPGDTFQELVKNSRVIGGIDFRSALAAQQFYQTFCEGELMLMSAEEAEAAKLIENAYRDVNIAFANEVSLVCNDLDIDPQMVIRAANKHPRVDILEPGIGVGGHCIPVDPWFLIQSSPEKSQLMRKAREVNEAKTDFVFSQIKKATLKVETPVIAFLGLSYKADIEDLRESPALRIVQRAADEGLGRLLVVEPHIEELPSELASHRSVVLSRFRTAVRDADIVVVLVAHSRFSGGVLSKLKGKTLIDGAGLTSKSGIEKGV